jgi:hypothetical protein
MMPRTFSVGENDFVFHFTLGAETINSRTLVSKDSPEVAGGVSR